MQSRLCSRLAVLVNLVDRLSDSQCSDRNHRHRAVLRRVVRVHLFRFQCDRLEDLQSRLMVPRCRGLVTLVLQSHRTRLESLNHGCLSH